MNEVARRTNNFIDTASFLGTLTSLGKQGIAAVLSAVFGFDIKNQEETMIPTPRMSPLHIIKLIQKGTGQKVKN